MEGSSSKGKASIALAAAVAAGISTKDLTDGSSVAAGSKLTSLSTITSVITGASILGLAAFYISRLTVEENKKAPEPVVSVQQPQNPDVSKPAPEANQKQNSQSPNDPQSGRTDERIAALNRPIEPPSVYILDLYPLEIKTSILDTFSGNNNFTQETSQQTVDQSQKAEQAKNGNLFSLLEKSGQDGSSRGPGESSDAGNSTYSSSEPEYSQAEEDERRDAIRQRFLEAIREAAERRAQAGQEY
jgi:hypothetical protein